MTRELELKDLLTAAMLPERRAAVERALAELESLRAEAERLKAENARQPDGMRYGINALDELSAEIERQRRVNEELLTVLGSIERTANQAASMYSPEPKP
jgi:hypothetical protein